jgi:hypothetical protein
LLPYDIARIVSEEQVNLDPNGFTRTKLGITYHSFAKQLVPFHNARQQHRKISRLIS